MILNAIGCRKSFEIYLGDDEGLVMSLCRSLSSKNLSTFGRMASKMSRHSSWSSACRTSPKVPPSCMYISSIAFVSPSFGRTQVSTHLKNKSKDITAESLFVRVIKTISDNMELLAFPYLCP